MATSEQLKILCVKLGISVSELARLNGTSPQAFSQKMKRDGFTPQDLKDISTVVGCDYESNFILSNGEKVYTSFERDNSVSPVAEPTNQERKCYNE